MRVDWSIFWPRILDATGDTLLMVIVTLIFAAILGIPLGLLLYVTRKGNFLENKLVFSILNIVINTIRPIPFIIFFSSFKSHYKNCYWNNNRNSLRRFFQ